jgi:hypothetical protein
MMAAAAFGCGSSDTNMNLGGKGYPGVPAAEAATKCTAILQKVDATCQEADSSMKCATCWTTCGIQCIQLQTCPETFTCPEF